MDAAPATDRDSLKHELLARLADQLNVNAVAFASLDARAKTVALLRDSAEALGDDAARVAIYAQVLTDLQAAAQQHRTTAMSAADAADQLFNELLRGMRNDSDEREAATRLKSAIDGFRSMLRSEADDAA